MKQSHLFTVAAILAVATIAFVVTPSSAWATSPAAPEPTILQFTGAATLEPSGTSLAVKVPAGTLTPSSDVRLLVGPNEQQSAIPKLGDIGATFATSAPDGSLTVTVPVNLVGTATTWVAAFDMSARERLHIASVTPAGVAAGVERITPNRGSGSFNADATFKVVAPAGIFTPGTGVTVIGGLIPVPATADADGGVNATVVLNLTRDSWITAIDETTGEDFQLVTVTAPVGYGWADTGGDETAEETPTEPEVTPEIPVEAVPPAPAPAVPAETAPGAELAPTGLKSVTWFLLPIAGLLIAAGTWLQRRANRNDVVTDTQLVSE